MTITLNLSSEVESRLSAKARERGVSLDEYLRELVTREARLSVTSPYTQASNLSDLLLNSPFAGANLDLGRYQDFPRQIDLE